MPGRRRLDQELLARGLVSSLGEAREVVEARRVFVSGAPAVNASMLVARGAGIRIGRRGRFVSRGGDKLAGALTDFGLAAAGKRCLDVGAGSGGFTDCLLLEGAREVVAVDVGYGQ
ncbi:MAG: SAM-dependent methyltransferase, partial [Actinomycetota bacterium]